MSRGSTAWRWRSTGWPPPAGAPPARHARSARLLTAALKINTDLERIGNLAMHIAERSISLMNHPLVKPMTDIPKMASLVHI